MDVEDGEENAEAEAAALGGFDPVGFSDLAVGGGDEIAFSGGDAAGGVAEEPEEKGGEQERHRCDQQDVGELPEEEGHDKQAGGVVVPITNHNQS